MYWVQQSQKVLVTDYSNKIKNYVPNNVHGNIVKFQTQKPNIHQMYC